MLRIISILLSVLIGFNIYGQQAGDRETIVFSKFPKESKLSFEPVFKLKKEVARRMFIEDTTLFIWNGRGAEDHFFYQYSLTGKRLSGGYIKGGQGHGQVFGAMSGGIYKNSIWLHDLVLDKFVMANRVRSSNGNDSVILSDYRLPVQFYSVQLMDSLKILGNGVYDSPYKIQELDLVSGKTLRHFGWYDKEPASIPVNSWRNAFQSFLFMRPTGDRAVLACRFTDQVEIFDLTNNKSKLLKGPENFEVVFRPIQTAGMDMMERIDDTRFAFINGSATKNFIYLLFSGHNHESEYRDTGKYIYVYDWDGHPVAKFTADRYLMSFVVSRDDKTIYAFESGAGTVVSTKISVE